MSEFINNREYRKETIKSILKQLHEGKSIDEVKAQFQTAFEGVSAEEISQAEQALIREGLPVSEVQRLCDVHAEVFKGSIEDIHKPVEEFDMPGHPAHTLKQENRAIEKLIEAIRSNGIGLKVGLEKLYEGISIHYKKKENLLFPYMEKYGVTAPPKVMWGVDDEIRELLKQAQNAGNVNEAEGAFTKTLDMIFKEENIMLPILHENLTGDEWKKIADESAEFGYCLIENVPAWKGVQKAENTESAPRSQIPTGDIKLPTGSFTAKELERIFNTLPVDITFVGKDDLVHYFSQSNERIFPRTTSIIGRNVTDCHPPASMHVVEKIVADFKSGAKDSEEFYIHMKGKYIYIRYFAVRDEKGEYMGVLEVTQNIEPLQAITGEKRLLSE
ncbi:MAG TPA: DUF438 domain-containing protein [Clostridia bacterium]|nr:DUF438 domain-containing protein [Clostridia bacterium]